MSIEISFVIPLFNEEAVFLDLVKRLNEFSESVGATHEFVLVDDGSKDQTPQLMADLASRDGRYHCIFLSRNFGHQYALSAGLMSARCTQAVMIIDGDLQDPPELFHEFYSKYKEGYDVIYGVRRNRKEGILKKVSYFLFYRVLRGISDSPIVLDSGDFSLLSKRVIDLLNQMPEDSRYLRGMRSWVGFRQIGIEYDRQERIAGRSKYTIIKLFQLAYDGVFNFSNFPIRFLTYAGIFCLLSSGIYFVITLIRKFWFDDVPTGFTALLFMVIFFGGIQLLSIGIIGEYVFRIFKQVKGRPLYIVRQRIINGKVV